MRLLLATTNTGKIEELQKILARDGIEIVGLSSSERTEEIETGSTFADNALLKARYFHKLTGLPTIADDSGLEVIALGGRPGVYSARYGGSTASDEERIQRLLEELKDTEQEGRAAQFVCVAAIVWAHGERVFEAEVRGRIANEPRGQGGFGYDPVFFYEPAGRTFAELTADEKSEVSHRGLAFRRLGQWLRDSGEIELTPA
jgi:XTP/dITP diphosphohydrolase